MKIINSKESAINSKWSNPGAKFYDRLSSSQEALHEAYLVVGDAGKDVPFARSGCKYPHHSINGNGDLVLNVSGVKAAYQRAKQMGIFKGDIKSHLMRHYKELDIYKDSQMEKDIKITENFNDIETYLGIDESIYMSESADESSIEDLEVWIDNVAHNGFTRYTEASHGKLKYDFRYAYDVKTGHLLKIVYSLDNINVDYAGHAYNPKDINKAQGSPLSNNPEANKEVEKSISKNGNIDHVSHGQIVKAIIDTITNQKLDEVDTISYMASASQWNVGDELLDKDEIERRLKSGYANLTHIKVGEIDNTPSFKSTKIFKGINALTKSMDGQMSMETGRGVKPDDLKDIYSKGTSRIPVYNNQNNKDAKRYLKDWIINYTNMNSDESNPVDDVTRTLKYWIQGEFKDSPEGDASKNIKISIPLLNSIIKELVKSGKTKEASIITKAKINLIKDGFVESSTDNAIIGMSISHDIIPYIERLNDLIVNSRFYKHGTNNNILTNTLCDCGFPAHTIDILESMDAVSIDNGDETYMFYIESSFSNFAESKLITADIGKKINKFKESLNNDGYGKYSMFIPKTYNMECMVFGGSSGDLITVDFNESFMDEYIDNYADEEKYIQKLLTSMDEIQYDKSIREWRLKSPSQTYKRKLGNCHDQSLYALNSLRQMGLEVGQLFFIELNEGEIVGGNTHTLTWYKKNGKYYWFEHSWENYRGIHGPYNSLEELKSDVYKSWENDNDINSKKYERIEFFDKPHYEIGMTLGEYVDSWTSDEYTERVLTEEDLKAAGKEALISDSLIEDTWFITSDDGVDNCCIKVKGYDKPMRGRSSMITLRQILGEWYIISKRNSGDDYGVPGGGWNKDEDPKDAAIRELHEEVQCNVKNVKRMGTLIEYHEDVAQWVKDHVPNENDWWYGYYSAVFVGLYDGLFEGEVEEQDKENGYDFKPLRVVNDKLPKEYQLAIHVYLAINEEFTEGFWDVIKTGAKKAAGLAKRFAGFLKAKKSLANLQRMDRPENMKARVPVTIIGTDIVVNTSHAVKEIVESINAFTEGAFTAKEIKSIISKLRKKFQCEIVFVNADSVYMQQIGPAAAAMLERDTINKIAAGKDDELVSDPTSIKNGLMGDQGEFNKIILVSPSLLKDYNLNSEQDVELLLTHEYGHILTYHQLTPDEWIDYTIKKQTIVGIGQAYGMYKGIDEDEYLTEVNWFYYQLKPEKIANEAGGINPQSMLKMMFGREAKGSLNSGLDLQYIVDMKLPDDIIKMNERIIRTGAFATSKEDIVNATKFSIDLYKKIIKDQGFQKMMLDALNTTLNFYSESTDIMNMFTEADENDPPELDEGEETPAEDPKQEETPEDPANDDIMNDTIDDEPPALDEEQPPEEAEEEPEVEEPEKKPNKPLSMPKQTDAKEKDKNGVRRKKLYIAFIEWCKEYNSKNTFGSVFDKDIFHNVYPFVPEEMRYFYRLANPILCVLAADLTFFQVSELRSINKKNKHLDKIMIFAATPDNLRVFNKEDKQIYLATEEDGEIILGDVIGVTFDTYIQNMIKKGDILNAPLDDGKEEQV